MWQVCQPPGGPKGGGEVTTPPIDRVLSLLQGVSKTANGWDAICPAHNDTNPSLGVAVGKDEAVLLKCRSQGCTAEAICRAIGLKLSDLFPAHDREGAARSGMNIVAAYDYVDPVGQLLYQVVRLKPKSFRQRRPDPIGTDGWTWNLKGVQPVLYRLPAVLKAIGDGSPVFVVEGEKDANNLTRFGFAATTNGGGAGKWRDEYCEMLRGADVVILPDNDPPGQSHAQQVASKLQGKARSVKVVNLPDLPAKGDVSDWIAAGGTVEQMRSLVDATPEWVPSAATTGAKSSPADDRPKIFITTEEHDVNEQAVVALARDQSIYQRSGLLVRIVRDVSPAGNGIRRPFAPRIDALPPALLRERLAANARWMVLQETGKGFEEKPARPPAWCVAAVHARGHWPTLRHLEAVVEYPVLRPDGTILSRPGYDEDTGLLLQPSGTFPELPSHFSREDAIAAARELLEVVTDFPFERDVHRAAWLAGLLTPLARFAFIGPAPLFLVDANVRAAGKGLLLDCISRIATGERFTIATYTAEEEELRKRITSLVLSGDRMVLFDNLVGNFGNGTLDAALTGTTWKDRLLGVNRMAEGPLYMTWYATGNNVAIAADTARRICHVRLESEEERPEERKAFRRPNLLGWVGENRPRLLTAALTILRAYCAAGRPDLGLPAWGSFEGWSSLVRSAVVWVGLPDPGETRLLLQERSDVAADSMGVLLACWEQLDPDRQGLTAAEVIQLLYKQPLSSPPAFHSDLKAALEALLGKPDSRSLGNRLRSYRRRMFQGRFIDQAGTEQRAARWAVFLAKEFHRRPGKTHETHETHASPSESDESRESNSAGPAAAGTANREVFEV
jgi:5S rRNA maturation endonuclease (ribonuclease M5)